jgi:hypothetical protein
MFQPPAVQTTVFDLYDQEWLPILVDLKVAFQQEEREYEGHEAAWWRDNHMTMRHGDLRQCQLHGDGDGKCDSEGEDWRGDQSQSQSGGQNNMEDCASVKSSIFDGDDSKHIMNTVSNTDIFIFQFVLHENASYLVDEDTGFIQGLVATVLQGACIGAFVVCTDSGNKLWPALKKTAFFYGWHFWSDTENAENGHKIMFGPKAFVILERVGTEMPAKQNAESIIT